jgi:hypothetical protein
VRLTKYPNSEIEIYSNLPGRVPRVDTGRVRRIVETPKPFLDIDIPVETEFFKRAEKLTPVGWGRPHRGKLSFRGGTKRRVQRLAGQMDSECESSGKVRMFVTLTCPGSSRSAVETFSAWTGYLQHSLFGWIARKEELLGNSKQVHRLHVWELQKRGAEHLHCVLLVSRQVFNSVQKEIRSWYSNLLERVCLRSGVDIFARSDGKGTWRGNSDVLQLKVEEVTRSVSAYLSKYLVKGFAQGARGFTTNSTPRPSRLWGASRCLKVALRLALTCQFWNFTPKGEQESLNTIMESLKAKGICFSVSTWRNGMACRIRTFFSGNAQREQSTKDEIISILDSVAESEAVTPRRIDNVSKIVKKAARIWETNAKRVAFDAVYGASVSQLVARLIREQPLSKLEKQVVFECIKRYDEVLQVDRPGPGNISKNRSRTITQLNIALFPPLSPR